jgi:hypothetical protein
MYFHFPSAIFLLSFVISGSGPRQGFAAAWVRIASSVLSASNPFLFNSRLAGSTLEAMRTQGHFHHAAKT